MVYSVLAGVMPEKKAAQLSGYNPSSKLSNNYPATTAQIRDTLQSVAGVTIDDQIGWLAGVRDGRILASTEQISAAKTINKVLGYDAPLQIEQHHKGLIAHAMLDMRAVLQGVGMTPRQLRDALRNRTEAPPAIEQKKIEPTGGGNLGECVPAHSLGCPSLSDSENPTLQMVETDEGVFDAVEK
jgi:hypothetical protein